MADANSRGGRQGFLWVLMLKGPKVVGEVKQVEASMAYPQVYCRAMPAVLEAIIHGHTRKSPKRFSNKKSNTWLNL